MKRAILLGAFCWLAWASLAAAPPRRPTPERDIQLTGIVWFGGPTYAALVIPQEDGVPPQELLLQEQQGAYDVEVSKIYPTTERVSIRYRGEPRLINLPPKPGSARSSADIRIRRLPPPGTKRVDLVLRQMHLGQVLHVYGMAADRTVLWPEGLPTVLINLDATPRVAVTEALQGLDLELAKQGVLMRLYEDKYVLALPANRAAQLLAQLPTASAVPAAPALVTNVAVVSTNLSASATNSPATSTNAPAATPEQQNPLPDQVHGLTLTRVPLEEALQFYCSLAGQNKLAAKFDSKEWLNRVIPPTDAAQAISLKLGAMSRHEVLHTFDIVLALNGYKVEFSGPDGLRLIRLATGLVK